MLATLALAMVTALAPPLAMVEPQDCRVEASELELIVKSGAVEARYPLSEREVPFAPGEVGPPRVTTLPLPGGTDKLLASLRETWDGVAPAGIGHLYEVTCGRTPSIRVAMIAHGVDFGRIALARDGRWIVGGWGGLRVLDPIAKRLTPLTSPPAYPAPGCWTAEDGKPARAADVPLVGAEGVARPSSDDPAMPEEIAFIRGGACGFEAELLTTRHALVLARGIVRRVAAIPTFAVGDDGQLLVGDGEGPCERHSAGTLWSSRDGETWQRIGVREKGGAGIARIAHLPAAAEGSPAGLRPGAEGSPAGLRPGAEGSPSGLRPGPWLVITALCGTGGGVVGGDLFVSPDLQVWEPVTAIPDGFSDVMSGGAGLSELLVDDDRAYVAAVQGKLLHWFESADARAWQPTRKRAVRPAPQALGKTLGVETIFGVAETPAASFAWTSDGLFRRAKAEPAGPAAHTPTAPAARSWARIFPR